MECKDATEVVLGSINAGGAPFLMQSAAVPNLTPPRWQWRTEHLTGEPLDEPADPDHDGTPNLLEFVFGTAAEIPRSAGRNAGRAGRRASANHHPAPQRPPRWSYGRGFIRPGQLVFRRLIYQSIAEGPSSLVVRDLTPLDTAHPRRFIRLKACLPSP